MILAEEIGVLFWERVLWTTRLNRVQNVQGRIDEIVAFIASSDMIHVVRLDALPIEGNLGHRISLAITSNPHIYEFFLSPYGAAAMRDVLPWMAARGTLEHMTSLQKVWILQPPGGMSVQDRDLIFPLLLTSSSLQELRVHFNPNDCDDAIMSVFPDYLSEATSLVSLGLWDGNLSQPAITCLCNGVAQSSLRRLIFRCNISGETNREAVAECLALAIAQSSLEELEVGRQISLDLSNTTPVRSLDFAFSQFGDYVVHFKINRKWKPLLRANVPLSLWPEILHKAHSSPETSHGPVGILFFLLREKADLIPRTYLRTGKRKRAD